MATEADETTMTRPAAAPRYVDLGAGDAAPWFAARSPANPRFVFDTAAGRHILLAFIGSSVDPAAMRALAALGPVRGRIDDDQLSFFGVTIDPEDENTRKLENNLPGIRWFFDGDLTVSRLYGAAPTQPTAEPAPYRRFWLLLDPALRVLKRIDWRGDGDHAELVAAIEGLPARDAAFPGPAPVLVQPGVFSPEFCERLVRLYDEGGNEDSGFMRQVDGKTVGVMDYSHKRRRDHNIEDRAVIAEARRAIERKLVPMIERVHQFKVTRMERYIVACYSAEEQGHFRAHRDNTTAGTAHRRFAVTINLNSEYEGGKLYFPEFSRQGFKPPVGGAVVFSCSLLHRVEPVTAGVRYAFLPFLYDEAAAAQREANNASLGAGVGAYRSGIKPPTPAPAENDTLAAALRAVFG